MSFTLTMEQQLKLRFYEQQAKHLTQEELANLVVELARQLMIKDNAIKNIMKDLI